MGYIESVYAADGMLLELIVRQVPRPARVAAMPFVPHRYHRG
jgi:aminomethyltransferase